VPGDRVGVLVELECEVEGGRVRIHVEAIDLPARRPRRPDLVQSEDDLEEWVAAGVALEGDLAHDRLERDVGVREVLAHGLARAVEQRQEGDVAAQIGAQRQRAREQAQQGIGLGPCGPGARGADDDVVLAGEAVQQRLEHGQQDEEDAGSCPARELTDGARHRLRQGESVSRALEAHRRGPGVVGWQGEDRRPAQAPAPVGDRLGRCPA